MGMQPHIWMEQRAAEPPRRALSTLIAYADAKQPVAVAQIVLEARYDRVREGGGGGGGATLLLLLC